MNENDDQISSPHLTAKELLSSKGICSRLIDEYNQVSKVLPKTGVKLFEPDGSWLQNKQIDTSLLTRKDLIKIERVNRLSTLAIVEWLPHEKKAKVIKKSGIEWNNYGYEIRGNLYLIPEEALLLLELNYIELLYNGLPLSIQQAYDLLLNSSDADCTLSEYRVFSQLARLGYRLKRFQYEKFANEKTEETVKLKKKIVIEAENGRWMGKGCDPVPDTAHSSSENNETKKLEENKKTIENINDEKYKEKRIKDKPRVEIISEETVLDPVKLVVNSTSDVSNESGNKMIQWSGIRIQQNMNQLPKQTDPKVSSLSLIESSKIPTTSQSSIQSDPDTCTNEKRKTENVFASSSKKSKQEIIELSDDEIEEIPRAMTRMEMLNCIPNIASNNSIRQIVSKGYIPYNIKPHKNVYEYDRARISRIEQCNRNAHTTSVISTSNHGNINDQLPLRNSLVSYQNSSNHRISPFAQNNLFRYNTQRERNLPYGFKSFHYSSYSSYNAYRHRGLISRSNNGHMMNSIRNHYLSCFWSSIQINIGQNIAKARIALRNLLMQGNMDINETMYTADQYHRRSDFRRQNSYRNSSPHHSHRIPLNVGINNLKQSEISSMIPNKNTQYSTSFMKIPADTWSDLKNKWKELKIITIEDVEDKMDCSEVEIVQRNVQPLVNAKNVRSISEIYHKLKIIKSAQPKTVRRKKGEYKISYKVYSNSQRYRKSDPGIPMFHLVIARRTNNFLQPVELNRLQQDGGYVTIIFAYVSDTSVSFMQAGLVSLPNLTDK